MIVSDGQACAPGDLDVLTDRLRLCRPAETDLDELSRLYTDPRIAEEDPLLLHLSADQTRAVIAYRRTQWTQDGLSSWVIRRRDSPTDNHDLIGMGGCTLLSDAAWNVAFTLHPDHWGKGYAQEVALTGIELAHSLRPELPVTAVVAERNARSRRTIERLGLQRRWEGPDAHSTDPTARVVLYADRQLSAEQVRRLTS